MTNGETLEAALALSDPAARTRALTHRRRQLVAEIQAIDRHIADGIRAVRTQTEMTRGEITDLGVTVGEVKAALRGQGRPSLRRV
jgi:hypothetical protein